MDDLVRREGLWYKKFTDVPFTGEVDEGLLRGPIKDGKMDGLWRRYHGNGQLKFKGHFKDGKREGYWISFHSNGQLSGEGRLENGNLEGFWVGYNEDGSMDDDFTGTYKNDVKVSD